MASREMYVVPSPPLLQSTPFTARARDETLSTAVCGLLAGALSYSSD